MEDLTKELRRLRESDPDVMRVLDAYRELRRDYNEVRAARRLVDGGIAGTSSAAKTVVAVGERTTLSNY